MVIIHSSSMYFLLGRVRNSVECLIVFDDLFLLGMFHAHIIIGIFMSSIWIR